MLKRIYADNYKSLVNFDISLDNINLFLGVNGSGKSAVFEILRKIKDLAAGEGKASDFFLLDDFTRWQNSPLQTFELTIDGKGGSYG